MFNESLSDSDSEDWRPQKHLRRRIFDGKLQEIFYKIGLCTYEDRLVIL